MADNGDYRVGYGKPPTKSRWRKGQSGNPTGSRRGVKKFSTLLHEVLQKEKSAGGHRKWPAPRNHEA